MPKLHTHAESAERKQRVIEKVRQGKEIKRIAADEGLSMIGIRKMLWAEGWRAMHLSEPEREHITLWRIKRKKAKKGRKR